MTSADIESMTPVDALRAALEGRTIPTDDMVTVEWEGRIAGTRPHDPGGWRTNDVEIPASELAQVAAAIEADRWDEATDLFCEQLLEWYGAVPFTLEEFRELAITW